MKTCPRCGHENPETATLCEQCHEALSAPDSAAQTTAQPPAEEPPEAPPEGVPAWPGPAQELPPPSRMSGRPREPVPLPPPAFWTKKRQYLLGLGLGLVPVVLLLAGVGNLVCAGGGRVIAAAGYLYVAQIVGGLIGVCFDRIRSVGYGLLTMTLAGPIVAAIGCAVILSHNPTVQPAPPPLPQRQRHRQSPSPKPFPSPAHASCRPRPLFGEIVAQGYPGGESQVKAFVQYRRPARQPEATVRFGGVLARAVGG